LRREARYYEYRMRKESRRWCAMVVTDTCGCESRPGRSLLAR
jgi:hypothetical protein